MKQKDLILLACQPQIDIELLISIIINNKKRFIRESELIRKLNNNLTKREKQFLSLSLKGKLPKDIIKEMNFSNRTYYRLKEKIRKKIRSSYE